MSIFKMGEKLRIVAALYRVYLDSSSLGFTNSFIGAFEEQIIQIPSSSRGCFADGAASIPCQSEIIYVAIGTCRSIQVCNEQKVKLIFLEILTNLPLTEGCRKNVQFCLQTILKK